MFIPDDPELQRKEIGVTFPGFISDTAMSKMNEIDKRYKSIPENKSSFFKTAAKETAQTYKEAVPNFIKEAGRNDESTSKNTTLRIAENAAGATKSGIETLFAPITGLIKGASEKMSNNKSVQKFASENPAVNRVLDFFGDATGEYSDFKTAHPQAARNLESALTIGLTAVGEKPVTKAGSKIKGVAVDSSKKGASALEEGVARTIEARKIASEVKKTQETIDTVSPMLTKKELQESVNDGTLKYREKGKGVFKKIIADFSADPQVIKLANESKGIVDPKKTFSENHAKVSSKIENISEQVIKPFLAKDPQPFNYADFIKKMELVEPSNSFVSSKNPKAFQTYSHVRERVLASMAENLRETARKKSDFGNVTDYNDVWEARKALDSMIKTEMKNFAFDTPQYIGAKAAAQDMRSAFKDFIIDSLQYPGQMDKVNKMQEFLATWRTKGHKIPNEKEAMRILHENFGITNTPEDVMSAAFFRDQMERLHSLYEVKRNLADKSVNEFGTNPISRWTKKHKTATRVIGWGTGIAAGSTVFGKAAGAFND